jgi:hypothetical protein
MSSGHSLAQGGNPTALALVQTPTLELFWARLNVKDAKSQTLAEFIRRVSPSALDKEVASDVRNVNRNNGSATNYTQADLDFMWLRSLATLERDALVIGNGSGGVSASSAAELFKQTNLPPWQLGVLVLKARKVFAQDTQASNRDHGRAALFDPLPSGQTTRARTNDSARAVLFVLLARFFAPAADAEDSIRQFIERNNRGGVTGVASSASSSDSSAGGMRVVPGLRPFLTTLDGELGRLIAKDEAENKEDAKTAALGSGGNALQPTETASAKIDAIWDRLLQGLTGDDGKRAALILSQNLMVFNNAIAILAARKKAARQAKRLDELREEQLRLIQYKQEETSWEEHVKPTAFEPIKNLAELKDELAPLGESWTEWFGVSKKPLWAAEAVLDAKYKELDRRFHWWFDTKSEDKWTDVMIVPVLGFNKSQGGFSAARHLVAWLALLDAAADSHEVTLLDEYLAYSVPEDLWEVYKTKHKAELETREQQVQRIQSAPTLREWFPAGGTIGVHGIDHLLSRVVDEQRGTQGTTRGLELRNMLRAYDIHQWEVTVVPNIKNVAVRAAAERAVQSFEGAAIAWNEVGEEALVAALAAQDTQASLARLVDVTDLEVYLRRADAAPVAAFMLVDGKEFNRTRSTPAAVCRIIYAIPTQDAASNKGTYIGTLTVAFSFAAPAKEKAFQILRLVDSTGKVVTTASASSSASAPDDESSGSAVRDSYDSLSEAMRAGWKVVSGWYLRKRFAGSAAVTSRRGVECQWWNAKPELATFRESLKTYQQKLTAYRSALADPGSKLGRLFRGSSAPDEPTRPQLAMVHPSFFGESSRMFAQVNHTRALLDEKEPEKVADLRQDFRLPATFFNDAFGYHNQVRSLKEAYVHLTNEFARQVRVEILRNFKTCYLLWTDEKLRLGPGECCYVTFCTTSARDQAESLEQKREDEFLKRQGRFVQLQTKLSRWWNKNTATPQAPVVPVSVKTHAQQDELAVRRAGNGVYQVVDSGVLQESKETGTQHYQTFTLRFYTYVLRDCLTAYELFPIDPEKVNAEFVQKRLSHVNFADVFKQVDKDCVPLQQLHHMEASLPTDSSLMVDDQRVAADNDERLLRRVMERETREMLSDISFRSGVVTNASTLVRSTHYKNLCWINKAQEKDIVGTLLTSQKQDYRWVLSHTSPPELDPPNQPSIVFLYMSVPHEAGVNARCIVRYALQPHYSAQVIEAAASARARVSTELPSLFTVVPKSKSLLRPASERIIRQRIQDYEDNVASTRLLLSFAPSDLFSYTERSCPLVVRGTKVSKGSATGAGGSLSDDDDAGTRGYSELNAQPLPLSQLLSQLYGEPCRAMLFPLFVHYLAQFQRIQQDRWLEALPRLLQDEQGTPSEGQRRGVTEAAAAVASEDLLDAAQFFPTPAVAQNPPPVRRGIFG